MGTFTAFLTSKGVGILSAAGGSLLLWILAKSLPSFAARKAAQALENLLKTSDSDFKEWLLATVKYAEKKFPNRGEGKQRLAFAVKLLTMNLSKFLKQDQIEKIMTAIEEAIYLMDEELKKAIEKNKPAPPGLGPV